MAEFDIGIIGGGAAGICAAISAGRRGKRAVICERLPQIGKKILATGNGRCNLLNEDMGVEHYNPASRPLVRSIFARYGKAEIMDFFDALGLRTFSKDGRIFPATNQASSVLKVLELELRRLSVPVELNFECTGIETGRAGFVIASKDDRRITCRKVVVTGGGKTYPVLGSNGSAYWIAAAFGHTIIEPAPCAVPLVSKDKLCYVLQGQRISAAASAIIDGKKAAESEGELLFTKYGLSGTCILDVSEPVSLALNREHKKDVFVSGDLVPFMKKEELKDELKKRHAAGWPEADMLAGILPNKLSAALKEFAVGPSDKAAEALKAYRFRITGTRGWNEAEFTAGGVDVREVKTGTLESKLKTGVYFAGEVLDVNGERGGYNLGWAWASGLAACETL